MNFAKITALVNVLDLVVIIYASYALLNDIHYSWYYILFPCYITTRVIYVVICIVNYLNNMSNIRNINNTDREEYNITRADSIVEDPMARTSTVSTINRRSGELHDTQGRLSDTQNIVLVL